jgi:hypothetical protein
MFMNKSISLKTVDLFAPSHVQRNSESSIETESLVSPVKKPKLPVLRKIGIPNPPATLKKPSRWARAKAAIYNSPSLLAKTLSLFQRTPSSSAFSEEESYSALINNPSSPLPTSLEPLLPSDFTEPPNTSQLCARAENFFTGVNSESDTEYVDCDFENKVDESLKKIVEEKLPTEPLQGRSIIRAKTSSRIQNISDSNVLKELMEVKNQDIILPTYGKGNTASRLQNFGNEDEACACISFSPTPVVRYYASSRSAGNGGISGHHNMSGLRQNATNATRLIQQCSPVAFAIPDRSSTPIATVASSVRFSTPTSSPHTATHLSSSVLIHPNVATAADHLYGESEVLVIKQPRSSVVNEPVGLRKEKELEAISEPFKQPVAPSNDVRRAGSNPNSKSQPVNIDSPITLSSIANVMVLGDLHDLQKGNRALTMLIQLPSFGSSPWTMRFDRWIKLFDNIVAMSDWTSDETVNMLVTKLTGRLMNYCRIFWRRSRRLSENKKAFTRTVSWQRKSRFFSSAIGRN